MKPKDLKYPYSWEERKIVLQDSVLFVPEHYHHFDEYHFPGWSSPEVFGNTNPVYVEYCSGNGTWIFEQAKANPEVNWVAVEKRFDRVRKIWSKMRNQAVKNLFIVFGEALISTEHFFQASSVSKVFVNFPDPWPKDRHAKHRLIQAPFVSELSRILSDRGEVNLVTDDPTYSEQMIEVMRGSEPFSSIHPDPYFVTEAPGYGSSFFEELWRGKGRVIRYHQFRKGHA